MEMLNYVNNKLTGAEPEVKNVTKNCSITCIGVNCIFHEYNLRRSKIVDQNVLLQVRFSHFDELK